MQVGKYELIRELAVGGMAEVFLARTAGPMGFEKRLVLKRILPQMAKDPAFIQMFLSEATLAARLTHPNIVQIFDFGESDGTYYLAMEYMDGPSLRTLLEDSLRRGGPLPPVPCARIIASACEGLAFAHDFRDPATGQPLDIVHRDISPDNLLLSRQGAVKVADFGVAKASGQLHRTQTGMIKGKLAYMPPEQIRNQPLDRRVDVYSLGIVFYELLVGQRPFTAPTDASLMHAILYEPAAPAAQLRPELPAPVLRILERATAKDREQRYPDCAAFQAELEEFILSTGKPVTTQHIAQLIEQVSPPVPDASVPPPTPLPLGDVVLTNTVLRQAPSPDLALPASQPLSDTALRAVANPDTPQAAPARTPGRARVAIAGAVLLVIGGGYLRWGREAPEASPVPLPVAVPAPTSPVPPVPAVEPAPPAPAASPAEPVAPPAGVAPATAPAPLEPAQAPAVQPGEPGLITFEVTPAAAVFINGTKAMEGTRGELVTPPGTWTVRFSSKKLQKTVERSIEVKPGHTVFLQVDLRHDEEAPKP
jgi:serine/threonine protein kinase